MQKKRTPLVPWRSPRRFTQGSAAADVKLAYIDPLSGGAASAGIIAQKHFILPRRQDQCGGRTQRREAADRLLRQQGRPAGVADRAQEGARRGRALRLPGQRQRGGARHLGRRAEVQRAQSRQRGALLQLRGGGPCADQREMQLLALPVRLRCGHEDGGVDHQIATQPRSRRSISSTRTIRSAKRSQPPHARCSPKSAPTSRSSATSCTRCRRSRTSRRMSPRSRHRARTP